MAMNKISSLECIGIPWKGTPRGWLTIPKELIPTMDMKRNVKDCSGEILYKLVERRNLGEGTYGIVDEFEKRFPDGRKQIVAIKRGNDKEINFMYEGLFQFMLYNEMKALGYHFCIPQVYDIIRHRVTNDIWYSMEAFEPYLLSEWCVKNLGQNPKRIFALILLQISLVLHVFENTLGMNHRDFKMDNMIVVNQDVNLTFDWNNETRTVHFPFRIVFIDFGFTCVHNLFDMKHLKTGIIMRDNLPNLDPCPKEGNDIFQILVSIWSIKTLRGFLEAFWGGWIRERLCYNKKSYASMAERFTDPEWMYKLTDLENFKIPLCAPAKIITDCLSVLEG
jgi:serine/threonine protein kinase